MNISVKTLPCLNRIFTFLLCLCLCLSLFGCSSEIRSESEARRVLLTTFSDLTDLSTYIKTTTMTSKTIDTAQQKLASSLETIESTSDYYAVDTVKEKYDSVMSLYTLVSNDLAVLKASLTVVK